MCAAEVGVCMDVFLWVYQTVEAHCPDPLLDYSSVQVTGQEAAEETD